MASYRRSPSAAAEELHAVPAIAKHSVQRKASAVATIQGADDLIQRYPVLPASRPMQDSCWGMLFALIVIPLIAADCVALSYAKGPSGNDHKFFQVLGVLAGAALAGLFASIILGAMFVRLARLYATAVIYTLIGFKILFFIALGGILFFVNPIAGAVLILSGLVLLGVYLCCWNKFIPFTSQVLTTVASIAATQSKMFLVGFTGSVFAIVWSTTCFFMWVIAIVYSPHHSPSQAVVFALTLITLWGSLVTNSVPFVAYCGVYGRWYYSGGASSEQGGRTTPLVGHEDYVNPSVKVALTSSFGSICLGSFVVAFIRALAAMADKASQDTDNVAVACIALIVKCLLSCIGDFVEYLNEWAYVQCAVRGCKYVHAAQITYGLCTCANVKYLISDTLLGTVTTGATLIISIIGCVVSFAVAWACKIEGYDSNKLGALAGILGMILCCMVCSAIIGVFSAGAKTLMVCWAEDHKPLVQRFPEMEASFERILNSKLGA